MDALDLASKAYVGFLFGCFCAYWAQQVDRDALAWFLFGWLLPPVAGLALLYLNARRTTGAAAGADRA